MILLKNSRDKRSFDLTFIIIKFIVFANLIRNFLYAEIVE